MEIYNEDTDEERTINNHGSERKVFNKNVTEVKNRKNGFMLRQTNLGDVAKFFGKYNYIQHVSWIENYHKTKIVNF